MYLNFYRLKKEPFHITPDPEFLYLSQSHREALGSIIYGIDKKKGFVSITGAVGVGKTTILRSYLEQADKNRIKAIYIFNPNVSFKSLLKTIFDELNIEKPATDDVPEMVNRLHYALIEDYKKGFNVVLVIDEAQNTPIATLENLRMLSNLETAKEKLIQIVMIGQPEFDELLNRTALRQINQRIAIRSVILPLSPKESLAYINHRLSKAAMTDNPIFTQSALKKIIKASCGIPRSLNILCDNALITGFGYQRNPVTAHIVREVIADLNGEGRTAFHPWRYAAATMGLIAALGLFWLSPYSGPFKRVSVPARSGVALQLMKSKVKPIPVKPIVEIRAKASLYDQRPIKKRLLSKVVRKGDSLSKLALGVYGYCDQQVLDRVKNSNPCITNIHKILAGREIIFPELEGQMHKNPNDLKR